MLRRVLPALGLLPVFVAILTASASSDPANDAPPIVSAELLPFAAEGGHGSIKGHIEIRYSPISAETETVGSARVFLIPAIPYTKWYFMDYLTNAIKRFHGRADIRPATARLTFEHFADSVGRYSFKTTADEDGRFSFDDIATGNYYVIGMPSPHLTETYGSGDDAYVYSHYALAVLGNETPLSIVGDRSNPTNVTRFVPSERARTECSIGKFLKPCDSVLDLDQFLGAHDY